jgi:hypothetical protein
VVSAPGVRRSVVIPGIEGDVLERVNWLFVTTLPVEFLIPEREWCLATL